MRHFSAILTVTLVGLVACKPQSAAEVKSLDNFAAGKRVTLNDCDGDPKLSDHPGLKVALKALDARTTWKTKKDRDDLRSAIHRGFAAIPPDFQATFLELGGQIIVSSSSNLLCTVNDRLATESKALAEGLDKVSACYLFLPPSIYKQKTGRDGQMLTLVMPDDETEIRHAFVRSFGYLVSQMYARLQIDVGSKKVSWLSVENPDFRAVKDQVAKAFLQDLRGTADAKRFEKYLADGDASALDKRSLADFVYAEAFDSYFCNAFAAGEKNTRRKMEKQFPHTFAAFSGKPSASGGFGLTGGVAGQPVAQESGSALGGMDHALTVGHARSFANSTQPIKETMHSHNWFAAGAQQSGSARSGQAGFSLEGAPRSEYNDPVDRFFQEMTLGAQSMYSSYYNTVTTSMDSAANAELNRTQGNPSALNIAASVVPAVSKGTGYTDVYNNIHARTDNIYNQVREGRGLKPTDHLNYLDSASVLANATVDHAANIPGVTGFVAGTAKNIQVAGNGGSFDANGNFYEPTVGERVVAGGTAGIGILNETGATEYLLKNASFGAGGFVSNWAATNKEQLSGGGQVLLEQGGKGMQQLSILSDQVQTVMDDSQIVKGLSGFGGAAPTVTNFVSDSATQGLESFGTAIDTPTPQPVTQPADTNTSMGNAEISPIVTE